MKRGYKGVYHHWSPKHTRRYINEFVFRPNECNVRNRNMDRIAAILDGTVGKRLTYKKLTSG